MAKRVRDAVLDSRAARAKLKPQKKPYFRALDRGLHLGYRRGKNGGTWVVRRYVGDEQYTVEALGTADDSQDADGTSILTFHQAQVLARGRAADMAVQEREAALGPSPTVKDAVDAYVEAYERRTGAQGGRKPARGQLTKHVLADEIHDKKLHEITRDSLKEWRRRVADKGLAVDTVRRICNDFRAALNAAAEEHHKRLPAHFVLEVKAGLAATERGHSPVAREAQVLPDADVRRIIAAAWEVDREGGWEGDLARLVLVLAATGARFSQVARITVGDVQPAQGRIMVPASHKGRGAKKVAKAGVPVGEDVIEALRPAMAGRVGTEPLLVRWKHQQVAPMTWERVARTPWTYSKEFDAPWHEITNRAGLPAGVVPYALRHSSIVRGLRQMLPVRLVAALHDTSSAMIEAHYSAFIVSALDELAAKAVVPLAPQGASVTKLRSA